MPQFTWDGEAAVDGALRRADMDCCFNSEGPTTTRDMDRMVYLLTVFGHGRGARDPRVARAGTWAEMYEEYEADIAEDLYEYGLPRPKRNLGLARALTTMDWSEGEITNPYIPGQSEFDDIPF